MHIKIVAYTLYWVFGIAPPATVILLIFFQKWRDLQVYAAIEGQMDFMCLLSWLGGLLLPADAGILLERMFPFFDVSFRALEPVHY